MGIGWYVDISWKRDRFSIVVDLLHIRWVENYVRLISLCSKAVVSTEHATLFQSSARTYSSRYVAAHRQALMVGAVVGK